MHHRSHVPSMGAPSLPCDFMRRILDVARLSHGRHARLVELATLSPCPVVNMARAPIELANLKAGVVMVPNVRGHWTEVALDRFGVEAFEEAAEGRTEGPVLVGDWGRDLVIDASVERIAIEAIEDADPHCASREWNLASLRDSIIHHSIAAGVALDVVAAQAGESSRERGHDRRIALLDAQIDAACTWSRSLGLDERPGGRDEFHRFRRSGGFEPSPIVFRLASDDDR